MRISDWSSDVCSSDLAEGGYDSFNQFIVKGRPAAGLDLLYDTLMVNAADEAFTEYGLLAETVAVPEDRSWVEFTLHGDARWHDGKPITVEAVIWTFHRSEEHTSELQSLMRISYAVFCFKKKRT